MALKALHPNISIHCLAEPYDQKKVRPDIIYKKNGVIFAILEYKVPGAVAAGDFQKAKLPWTSSQQAIAAAKMNASGKIDNTLFGGKSTVLMKQLTRYVDETPSTRYAALFNWDHLFLTVYDKQDTEFIYGTLISSTGKDADKLRKAYLGWLMEALENDGKCKLNPVGGRPNPDDKVHRESRHGSGSGAGSGSGSGSSPGSGSGSGSGSGNGSGSGAEPQGNASGKIPDRTRGDAGKTSSTHGKTASESAHGIPSSISGRAAGAKPATPNATLPVRHAQDTHRNGTSNGQQTSLQHAGAQQVSKQSQSNSLGQVPVSKPAQQLPSGRLAPQHAQPGKQARQAGAQLETSAVPKPMPVSKTPSTAKKSVPRLPQR
jgi:hypothetical protein